MPDDAPEIDQPDADSVYERHLKTCRLSGVEPISREHAQELIAEWSEVIARSAVPPITH